MGADVFGPGQADCVFCHPEASPGSLLEGPGVRLIPDLFPVVPGHLLVVSLEHLPAYGAASPEVLADLERVTHLASAFVEDAYGVEPVLWENGGAGQTVFHAHLHVMPVRPEAIHEVIESEHMEEVADWPAVAARWRERGSYHYLEFEGHRRVAEGNSEANWEFRRRLAITAGLRYVEGRWLRATTPDDVAEAARRWAQWSADGAAAARPGPGLT